MRFIERSIGDVLLEQVEKYPDKEFLVYSDRDFRLTYRQFKERVDKMAKGMLAFVILKDGATLTPEEVRDFCRGQIARYKIPQHVFFVQEYPVTGNGKVQKYKLRELALHFLQKTE
jgi:acyl-CoA synthetase (AMP-forming)/AMP-acid ligase II